jgi:hypothetical protein
VIRNELRRYRNWIADSEFLNRRIGKESLSNLWGRWYGRLGRVVNWGIYIWRLLAAIRQAQKTATTSPALILFSLTNFAPKQKTLNERGHHEELSDT